MKHKLLITLLSLTLIPATSFAAKPVKIPEPGQAVWVDANGTMLGDVQTNVGVYDTRVYFEAEGKFYTRRVDPDDGFEEGTLSYDQPECTGNAYTHYPEVDGGIEYLQAREGVLYGAGGESPQTVTILSEWHNSRYFFDPNPEINCVDFEEAQQPPMVRDNMYPAVPIVDTNIYTKPFRLKLTPPT